MGISDLEGREDFDSSVYFQSLSDRAQQFFAEGLNISRRDQEVFFQYMSGVHRFGDLGGDYLMESDSHHVVAMIQLGEYFLDEIWPELEGVVDRELFYELCATHDIGELRRGDVPLFEKNAQSHARQVAKGKLESLSGRAILRQWDAEMADRYLKYEIHKKSRGSEFITENFVKLIDIIQAILFTTGFDREDEAEKMTKNLQSIFTQTGVLNDSLTQSGVDSAILPKIFRRGLNNPQRLKEDFKKIFFEGNSEELEPQDEVLTQALISRARIKSILEYESELPKLASAPLEKRS